MSGYRITSLPPLQAGQSGPAVANYQAILSRLDLVADLAGEEIADAHYGDGTAQATVALLARAGLAETGSAGISSDDALKINAFLAEQGLFSVASGHVAGAEPRAGLTVRVFDRDNLVGEAAGVGTTNDEGAYLIYYDPGFYADHWPGVVRPVARVTTVVEAIDREGRVARSGPAESSAAIIVDLADWKSPLEMARSVVRGTVVDKAAVPLAGVRIEICNRGIGMEAPVWLGTGRTDAAGHFAITYNTGCRSGKRISFSLLSNDCRARATWPLTRP
jgi:hypothetical protein